MGAVLCLALASLAGCAHRRGPPETSEALTGLELPLRPGNGIAAEVNGEVAGVSAAVVLDIAQPISRVTKACFGEDVPSSSATVQIPTPQGGHDAAEVLFFSGARIGGRRLGELRAALDDGDDCEVTVGSDVLAPYALELDPAQRVVRFLPSRTRADYVEQVRATGEEGPDELRLFELLRDPTGDWPLIAVRVAQGPNVLTGPFVVSTASSETALASKAAEQAGLQPGPAFLRELGVPDGRKLPANLGGNAVWTDRIELAPGFGFHERVVGLEHRWNGSAVGVLGGDVWGRFHSTFDPAAGVLLLRRPRVVGSGTRQRCATAGTNPREEACFVLEQREVGEGIEVISSIWRDLPEGAQVYFDALGPDGQPVGGLCRVGMTFPAGDRGMSAAHRVPWESMAESVPECAQELAQARAYRFSLMEDTPLEECSGTCVFAQGMLSERVSCECAGSAYNPAGELDPRLMELYRDMQRNRRERRGPPPDPDEPADPR